MKSSKTKSSIVSEAAISYAGIDQIPKQKLYAYKGGENKLAVIAGKGSKPEWEMTALEKMDLVQDGVNKQALESLKSKSNLDYDKLAAILSTNRATLINKKGKASFSPVLAERIVSVADIYSYGFEVFEEPSKFNDWIFKTNQAIGGQRPFDLLDNQFGREEIKNLIGRIAYGVYS